MNPIADLLAQFLRGEGRWPEGMPVDAFLDQAHLHGVSALLHAALETGADRGVPDEARAGLRQRAQRAAAVELGRNQELKRLLDAIARAGLEVLLVKGTPLAHSHYREPALRQRADTDLLVRPGRRHALFQLLEAEGYRRIESTGGELASSETAFWKDDALPTLDVHWRINNSPLLAGVLDFEALAAEAVAVPALGPHARAPRAADALLLAALHRASHFHAPFYAAGIAHTGDRLVWLYDLHLLAPSLTPAEAHDLARRAQQHRVAGLCLDALRGAQQAFGTAIPAGLLEALERAAARPEPSMAFLEGGRRRLLLAELRAVQGWDARWQLLREHAFPPGDYMLRKYATNRRWLLPALYVRRALGWLAK